MILDIDDKELTQDELDLLESLIGSKKEKKEKFKTKPCKQELKAYKLKVSVHCTICNSDHNQFFYMKEVVSGLASEKISEAQYMVLQIPDHTELKHIRSCGKCREVLLMKEKSELVELYIKARATFSGSGG